MRSPVQRELAHTMVELGGALCATRLLTEMNCPLSNRVGNALEVAEALEWPAATARRGGADARLAGEMLEPGLCRDLRPRRADGTAMDRFRRLAPRNDVQIWKPSRRARAAIMGDIDAIRVGKLAAWRSVLRAHARRVRGFDAPELWSVVHLSATNAPALCAKRRTKNEIKTRCA